MGKKRAQRGPQQQRPAIRPVVTLAHRVRELGANICGTDDTGRTYQGLSELWLIQGQQKDKFYRVNEAWWVEGYEGRVSQEGAMIGDDTSEEDVAHSRTFLMEALAKRNVSTKPQSALDCGAGLGRVTRGVLLPAVSGSATLVEQSAKWLRAARAYVGDDVKRCSLVCSRLEEYHPPSDAFDIIWIQWTLQYLIDEDVVHLLSRLGAALTAEGVLLMKENRPMTDGFESYFQMDTPGKEGRFDIVRPATHMSLLVELAGLSVTHMENWEECSCWVLGRPLPENAGDETSSVQDPP